MFDRRTEWIEVYIPVIMVVVNELHYGSRQRLVHSFIKAIGLGVVRRTDPVVRATQLKQLLVNPVNEFSALACVSQKTRKLLGPGNRPVKLPKRLSGVSQSTRKILSPKNTSFFPVNFTGTHYLPKSVFGSVFLVLA